jgi:hypothetical protein
MKNHLLRFGPSLLILLAALVYAATNVWERLQIKQDRQEAHRQEQTTLSQYKLPKPQIQLPQAECDAIPHYTPSISLPVFGRIKSISPDRRSIVVETGKTTSQSITIISGTRIISWGKQKPVEEFSQQMQEFNQKAPACNDGTRVYMAPPPYQEIPQSPAMIKPKQGVQILMDETVDSGKTTAAVIFLPSQSSK